MASNRHQWSQREQEDGCTITEKLAGLSWLWYIQRSYTVTVTYKGCLTTVHSRVNSTSCLQPLRWCSSEKWLCFYDGIYLFKCQSSNCSIIIMPFFCFLDQIMEMYLCLLIACHFALLKKKSSVICLQSLFKVFESFTMTYISAQICSNTHLK